ncbi:MAG TPA: hypothetical protein VGN84_10650, partial [Solirubrobacterales bacterium]|nr:hypothetical protein [Solirubrobacterales bacterium]
PLAAVPQDQRGDVADQDADRDGDQQGDDQRGVDSDEEDFDLDALRVLQGDDDDQRDQDTPLPRRAS